MCAAAAAKKSSLSSQNLQLLSLHACTCFAQAFDSIDSTDSLDIGSHDDDSLLDSHHARLTAR